MIRCVLPGIVVLCTEMGCAGFHGRHPNYVGSGLLVCLSPTSVAVKDETTFIAGNVVCNHYFFPSSRSTILQGRVTSSDRALIEDRKAIHTTELRY